MTADQTGQPPGVYLVYNAVDPDSIVDAETSYSSAGTGRVGRSLVYAISTTTDGASWSQEPIAVDAAEAGHQFFPDIDAFAGNLAVVWQDSRSDPRYSVQLPMGNDTDAEACGYPDAPETDIVNTLVAVSDDGETFAPSAMVSIRASAPVRDVQQPPDPVPGRLQLDLSGAGRHGGLRLLRVDRQPGRRAWRGPS